MHHTKVQIDSLTHEALERLAAEMGVTVAETVAIAVRHLRQERIGVELRTPLTPGEIAWLHTEPM